MTGRHVVVLAAGRGRRMGSPSHKALLPVSAAGGTLDLLLGWVCESSPRSVTVVTGFDARRVAQRVSAYPGVQTRRNPDFEVTGMLGSVRAGLGERMPSEPVLVLLGDAVYGSAFRAAVEGFGDSTTIPVRRPPTGNGPEVPAELHGNEVRGLGRTGELEMAAAVQWGPHDLPLLEAAAAVGAIAQWQALNLLLQRGGQVRAVEVPSDSVFDVDTPADLELARRRLS